MEVRVTRLPTGGHAFLRALMDGAPLGQAADVGLAAAAEFNLGDNLAILIGSSIVVGIEHPVLLAA
jgi:hypothetical protein